MTPTKLRIDQLSLDGGTQTRQGINDTTVQEYADALQAEAVFPPVTVFHDGAAYWLADGFHRVAAHRRLSWLEVDADVRQGTRRDAVLHSVGANNTHGLPRSNADKRRAVETLLRDEEWATWPQAKLAQTAGVSREYVNRIWKEIVPDVPSSDRSQDTQREVTRNGTTYTQNTANIGLRPAVSAPEAQPPAPAVDEAPTEDFPPFDRATGEIIDPTPAQTAHAPEPSYPLELLAAAQHPMSPAPYQPPSLEAVQQDAQLEELRLVLSRLLSFREKVNPEILTAGLMGGAVQNLAVHVHGMLGDWLAFNQPERDPMTITVEAQASA